jgi:hypothetical protein
VTTPDATSTSGSIDAASARTHERRIITARSDERSGGGMTTRSGDDNRRRLPLER